MPTARRCPATTLDPDRSGGDLCVQACADDPQVAFHVDPQLRPSRPRDGRAAVVAARVRTYVVDVARHRRHPRNLMGFKDGTSNIKAESAQEIDRFVWVGAETDQPWMRGGSYLVARRIRMLIESWDTDYLADQETVFGRVKDERRTADRHGRVRHPGPVRHGQGR